MKNLIDFESPDYIYLVTISFLLISAIVAIYRWLHRRRVRRITKKVTILVDDCYNMKVGIDWTVNEIVKLIK